MWFLVLQDIDGNRDVWYAEYDSRAAAIASIKDAVLMRPNTLNAYVCEVNDQFGIKLDVRLEVI
jgi:hypothetical protein